LSNEGCRRLRLKRIARSRQLIALSGQREIPVAPITSEVATRAPHTEGRGRLFNGERSPDPLALKKGIFARGEKVEPGFF
jgi:hypothetical protein